MSTATTAPATAPITTDSPAASADSPATARTSADQRRLARLQRAIVDGLEDVKAQDIRVFNTEELSPLFERVIIASANTPRQTRALAASVREAVKQAGFAPPRHEGEDNGEWVIVDCGACVAHIMQPAIRQYYRLEDLWGGRPVRVRLGSAAPSRRTASEDASQGSTPATSARKPRSTATAASATKAPTKAAAKPAAESAAKPAAPARAPRRSSSSGSGGAAVKTVIVQSAAVRKASARSSSSSARKAGSA